MQRKRLRNRFISKRGIAVEIDSKFRAANVQVPLYIYNVSKEVSMDDVDNYIKKKTDIPVTLEKINMKSMRQYDSYKVFVPKQKIDIFLRDDFWPEGIAYRRFVNFNRKKESKENTLD